LVSSALIYEQFDGLSQLFKIKRQTPKKKEKRKKESLLASAHLSSN